VSINSFSETLETFYKIVLECKKYTLGIFEKRQELFDLNNSDEPLSDELKYLYKNYDINLRFIESNINIINYSKLHKKQYGFKYISNDNGKTFEKNTKWNENWIVIADMNDDPIVADIGTEGTPIYAAIEGKNYKKIMPSLEIFFKILNELLKSSEVNNANELNDEDREEIIIPYFIKEVEKILDNECIINLKEFMG
jgi:hypothetical protein